MTSTNQNLSIPIGKGSFGYVNLIFNSDKEDLIARKVLINYPQAEKYIRREIENLNSLKNSYGFVHMISHEKNGTNYVVDMDFMPSGSLKLMLKNVLSNKNIDGYDSTQEIIVAYGIAYEMAKMHRLNKIHRDLKPDNILLDHNLFPHICDFGLARDYNSDQTDITRCGTRNYLAPEVLNSNKKITIQSDVYMLGMTMYEMVELAYPYQGLTEEAVKYRIFHHILPEFSEVNKNHRLIPVIKQCWEDDPAKRPTMEKLAELLSNLFDNDPDEFLDKDRFTKYVNFLKEMDTKDRNEISPCGTIKNLRIAAQRGNPFSIQLLVEAQNAKFNFQQETARIEKILRKSAGSDNSDEEEEYEPDLF